jgi:hypothetical protein
MKKIVCIFLIFNFFAYSKNNNIIYIPKLTSTNQTICNNTIELPFGFSVDLQHHNSVVWISKISDISDIYSVILSDYDDNRLILTNYPFAVPLGENLNIYDEDKFIAEIQNPISEVFKVFYENSTFYAYELNNNYTAYVSTSTVNDDMLASIFKNHKFIVSFFIDSKNKKMFENILYSIRQNDKSFSKNNYIKEIKELYENDNLQKALLYSSIYYLYDKNNKRNLELLNKIIIGINFRIEYIKKAIDIIE